MNEQNENNLSKVELPEAIIKKRGEISIVWIIPVVTIIIGLWLIYKAIVESGVPITVTFKDGTDIDTKTLIKYDGVVIGKINSVKLNKNLDGVIVKALLNRSAKALTRKKSQFWVVRPQIGWQGISGLDTIISGPYISVAQGKGPYAKVFKGLEAPPLSVQDENGLRIILKSDKLGSLHTGAPIYYREIKVGEIENFELSQNAQHVDIHACIFKDYKNLVHDNSCFWNASGIGMSVNLFGAKIKTESLAAIMSGGVAFATPDVEKMGPASQDGAVFYLSDSPEDAWLQWKPEIFLSGETRADTSTSVKKQDYTTVEKRNYSF